MRQYIGARYVIKIYENSLDASSAEWEASVNYEPLVMVTYNNGSYLSKKDVPASIGNPADNPQYWVQTGFYNGQIASLQNQIDTINNTTIPSINDAIADLIATSNLEYFRNKKVLIAGDSLSNESVAPPNWVTLFKNLVADVNCTVTNISFGGSSFTDGGGAGTGMAYRLTQENFANYDILIIESGTNDCTAQYSLGAWNTTSGFTTFCGAMWEVFSDIAAENPKLDVYWIIPPKRNLSQSDYPTPIPINVYRSVIVNMCNYFNWKLIDWCCGLSNLNPYNGNIQSYAMTDGIHIESAYAPVVCDYVIRKVSSGGECGVGNYYNQCAYTSFVDAGVSGSITFNYDMRGKIFVECILTLTDVAVNKQLFTISSEVVPTAGLPVMLTDSGKKVRLVYANDYWTLVPYETISNDTLVCQFEITIDKLQPRGVFSL